MCHMVIGGRKNGVLRMDLIVGALNIIRSSVYIYIYVCVCLLIKKGYLYKYKYIY